MLEREPFAEAARLFQREYLRRLQDRTGSNPQQMCQRSGLTPEVIAECLRRPGRS
jgi:hypothetical protein